jgi:hypothetical protein
MPLKVRTINELTSPAQNKLDVAKRARSVRVKEIRRQIKATLTGKKASPAPVRYGRNEVVD